MKKACIAAKLLILLAIMTAAAGAADRNVRLRYDVKSGLSSPIVGGGVQDSNGLMWFATWNGLNCYDGYDFHRVNIRPGDGASISTNRIRDILLSDDGNIICRTDDDIFEFNLATYSFKELSAADKSRFKDKVGRKWHGTTDAQCNLWTSDRSGLYKSFVPHHPAKILPGTEGEAPRAFMKDRDGNLWVGTRIHPGISVYSPDGRQLRRIELEVTPYCIFQTRSGDIWVGCKPGSLIKLGAGKVTDDIVYDIGEDSRGRLWIATFGEGIKCCPDPGSPAPALTASLGGGRVRKLIVTPADNIIAATTAGLLIGHIDNDDVSATKFVNIRRDSSNPSSLCSDATMSVARDSRGMIYISTESSGVDMISEESLFSATPEFTHISSANSVLAGDVGKAMALGADTLIMVVGNDNVMALNPSAGQNVNFSNTFWADTCDFVETTPLRLDDGSWVFGAEQGAFVATPHALYSRGYIPPIVFTTLAVNGGNEEFCLPPLQSLSLKADERNVTIRFAAIDFIDNGDILYRTRLDGSPWTPLSLNRSVTLFNLAPGDHLLEVQSTDRYGRRVDNTAAISITVAPYWYETWWAHLLFAVGLLGVVAVVVGTIIYVRRVNRQRRELLDKYMELISERDAVDDAAGSDHEASPVAIGEGQSPEDMAFLDKVRTYIEDNISNPDANVDDMGLAAAASRSTLNRRLRSLLGVSAAKLLSEARMQHAARLLREYPDSEYPVAKVAELCGFSDKYYFSRVFQKKYGVTPSEYRTAP